MNFRKYFHSFLSLICVIVFFSACQHHFIEDRTYRNQVTNDYLEKMALIDYADTLPANLSVEELEAMEFLYAYMPLCDLADYSSAFFLKNVRTTFQTKAEMNWGSKIPERLFRHFVLPVRVNNENLDSSRQVFYRELKPRVKNLSMKNAILEVNHWCHEYVKYTPSDARTLSPLSCVKTAIGRCGEESTFTVAALRSVGIPARQVYTPRWAHTDDNHAWVEAWADGRWYFLGACEPEPILDLAWFNAPASRGMLMHTRVFGKYDGPEDVMRRTPSYTEINVIDNYAPTSRVVVKVVDKDGQKISNARVDFKIYNYAEFHTVVTKFTDEKGQTSLTAGKGDMIVWASKEGAFGYKKVSFVENGEAIIKIQYKENDTLKMFNDIVPPPEKVTIPPVSVAARAENDRRFSYEDSIRSAYEATFFNKNSAEKVVADLGLDPFMVQRLVNARGNYETIIKFLKREKASHKLSLAQSLLQILSTKDLKDITLEVLCDHFENAVPLTDNNKDEYVEYILNPRIANEMVVPYRSFFMKEIKKESLESLKGNPQEVINWVQKHIKIYEDLNLSNTYLSPIGVWRLKKADKKSRDVFFVALARTLGIPAWIDGVTGKVEYKLLGTQKVFDVNFDDKVVGSAMHGTLILKYKPTKTLKNPKYYSHFTISKIVDGVTHLLNYEEGEVDMGGGVSWKNSFEKGATLDSGYYLLVTGTRLASGEVLSSSHLFTISEGETTLLNLVMSTDDTKVQVIGNFNSELTYKTLDSGSSKSLLSTTGRGYYIVGVIGTNQEPTNHALKDIARKSVELNAWGRSIVLLFTSDEAAQKFKKSEFSALPKNIHYGVDTSHEIQHQMVKAMKLKHHDILPIFFIADTFNRVVFSSQGYTVGVGDQLMKTIDGL